MGISKYTYVFQPFPFHIMPTDPKDPAVQAAEQRRKDEAGKPDSKIGFGGSILDMGEKDAEGVGAGK